MRPLSLRKLSLTLSLGLTTSIAGVVLAQEGSPLGFAAVEPYQVQTAELALNERFEDYARFEYCERDPGYACLRYFGSTVSDAMASSDNKWVLEQMMEIEAPEMVRLVKKLVDAVIEAGASRAADQE